jgi:hypothetical protein
MHKLDNVMDHQVYFRALLLAESHLTTVELFLLLNLFTCAEMHSDCEAGYHRNNSFVSIRRGDIKKRATRETAMHNTFKTRPANLDNNKNAHDYTDYHRIINTSKPLQLSHHLQ